MGDTADLSYQTPSTKDTRSQPGIQKERISWVLYQDRTSGLSAFLPGPHIIPDIVPEGSGRTPEQLLQILGDLIRFTPAGFPVKKGHDQGKTQRCPFPPPAPDEGRQRGIPAVGKTCTLG